MAWNEPGGKGNPNDPWGNNNRGNNNRGGGNQPPDLDEALKQLMDKLNGLLGGGKRNNNNGGNGGAGAGGMFGIVGAILVVFLGFQSVYTLDEQERGVVLRLGKYLKTENPGLRFKIPLVDQVITQTQNELLKLKNAC